MITTHRCWVYGDHVNTDVIFPGKYTYTLHDPTAIRSHALEDLDRRFAAQVLSGDVIVAGINWGCGSSREQAVTCLKDCGIRAIIAASFSGIYFRNCINQGLHPIVCPGLATQIRTGEALTLDAAANVIHANGRTFPIPALSPFVRAILDAGGLVAMLRTRFAQPGVPE